MTSIAPNDAARRFVDEIVSRYGVTSALSRARMMRLEYQESVPQWLRRAIVVLIIKQSVGRLGLGFHPDKRGVDYRPPLKANDIADYDADMRLLFAYADDAAPAEAV